MATWPPQAAYGGQSAPCESAVGIRECDTRIAGSSRVETTLRPREPLRHRGQFVVRSCVNPGPKSELDRPCRYSSGSPWATRGDLRAHAGKIAEKRAVSAPQGPDRCARR